MEHKSRVAIITDSGTDTPRDFAREHDVRIVPLRIIFPDRTYESGVDITDAELMARMQRELPTTSLPAPDEIMATIQQAKDDGYEAALIVTISSGLSGTYDTFRLLAGQVEDFPVDVVDTRNIGIAAGLIVMEAVRMAELGVPFMALRPGLEALAKRTRVYFAVKDLTYLRKGGRISEAVYRVGSVLNIKPVITCDGDGRYVISRKARGWDKALRTEVSLIEQDSRSWPKVRVAICCSASCNEFDRMEKDIRRQMDNVVEVVRSGISPDLLVHTGPDIVGLAVQAV